MAAVNSSGNCIVSPRRPADLAEVDGRQWIATHAASLRRSGPLNNILSYALKFRGYAAGPLAPVHGLNLAAPGAAGARPLETEAGLSPKQPRFPLSWLHGDYTAA